MKAFLSHSSVDKPLVSKVAKELGRIYSYFDQRDFNTGEELLQSINDGIEDSTVFVLFASQSSLKSLWVLHEINEAQYQLMLKQIEKIIVFIIDDTVQISDLPEFLKRCKIEKEIASGLIVTTIRETIQKQLMSRQPQFFVGRKQELETAQNTFAPLDGSPPPKIVGINGLIGIGRTTFLRRIVSDFLHFTKIEIISIEIAESYESLAIKMAAIVEPFNTEEGLIKFSQKIKNYSEERQVEYIKKSLKTILIRQILPVFNEDGGLIDRNSQWNPKMFDLLDYLSKDKEIYLFIVTRFKPINTMLNSGANIPFIKVNPLSQQEVNQLLAFLFNALKLDIINKERLELSEFINGYPPAAYHTASLIKEYGKDPIFMDKSKIIEFRSTTFVRYLNNLLLSEDERKILATLSFHSPLPLNVIKGIHKLSDSNISEIIIKLMDLSLVVTDQNSFVKLSPPIVDAVIREIGRPDESISLEVVQYLKHFINSLKNSESYVPLLEISRTLMRALLITDKKRDGINIITFVSDLIKVTEELYHQQDYRNAKSFAEEALRQEYNLKAQRILIKSLIKLGLEIEAEQYIDEMLELKKDVPEAYFLKGYLYRNKEENLKAIEYYKIAEHKGRPNNIALIRELAFCYFHINDMPNSMIYIEKFNNIDDENRFIIDLQIQIALKKKVEKKEVLELLEKLKSIDGQSFYLYRKSNIEYSYGEFNKAYESINEVYEIEIQRIKPQFLVQLITCELKVDKISDAENHYKELEEKFGFRTDLIITTKCRILLAKNLYQECLDEYKKLRNKDTENALYIKKDALQGILNSKVMSDELRLIYLDELEEIENKIVLKEFVTV